ncbi:MAG: NAD(P)-dependent oxidoreductase [Gemmatimonadetes bacterium]|nr:NAD(P)-dependent oxidoreductase [Gemmatimonadota bacterium]MYC72688.1 NAD(P)-dependent oxidoreductase [Gemmatimonadota bacterium]MYI61040.1 NAD(P)-dependent oxidoreductase [Gemmatimonadota bacterium]
MRVAVIGADRPWGALLAAELSAEFEVVAIGAEETSDLVGYRQVDLLQREALDPALAGVEAIVHVAGGDPAGDDEGAMLDAAARGTYVALTAACAIGIEKAVLLSNLDLLRDYPEEYLVDPQWNALPRAEAGSLAPLMAELVGREIARTGQIEVRCLRSENWMRRLRLTTLWKRCAKLLPPSAKGTIGRWHTWRRADASLDGALWQR